MQSCSATQTTIVIHLTKKQADDYMDAQLQTCPACLIEFDLLCYTNTIPPFTGAATQVEDASSLVVSILLDEV